MITHYDLFAGIGGFSYAVDKVFYEQEIEHIFCEWEAFPTAVLKKHWPDGTYYGDIADLVADTTDARVKAMHERKKSPCELTIVTGGFPCQPFSHAGRRKGTADDRYKWPEMFAIIQNVRPDWVIAENVRGFATWNDGMVLERTCADMESEGYEVQPFIIPACAVQAPHQRERVWIVAHTVNSGQRGEEQGGNGASDSVPQKYREEDCTTREFERAVGDREIIQPTPNTRCRYEQSRSKTIRPQGQKCEPADSQCSSGEWNRDWREVALTTCHDGVDDGFPRWMDGTTISAARHRKERLKACGNAIVPQVAMQILDGINKAAMPPL